VLLLLLLLVLLVPRGVHPLLLLAHQLQLLLRLRVPQLLVLGAEGRGDIANGVLGSGLRDTHLLMPMRCAPMSEAHVHWVLLLLMLLVLVGGSRVLTICCFCSCWVCHHR
jgi:hypothetical protein